ncbi:hypothetical protein DVA81_18315 [Acinetobacter baumannii]|nr:hypothetical protein DVA81_18315 [Acinetobacter baumannii]
MSPVCAVLFRICNFKDKKLLQKFDIRAECWFGLLDDIIKPNSWVTPKYLESMYMVAVWLSVSSRFKFIVIYLITMKLHYQ